MLVELDSTAGFSELSRPIAPDDERGEKYGTPAESESGEVQTAANSDVASNLHSPVQVTETVNPTPSPLLVDFRQLVEETARFSRSAYDTPEDFERELRGALIAEPVEDGYTHHAEAIIQAAFDKDADNAAAWASSFIRKAEHTSLAAGALKCLGRLSCPGSQRWRLSLLRETLAHPSSEMRDAAVQAIESWGENEAVELLRKHSEESPWLHDYIKRVIEDLTAGSVT